MTKPIEVYGEESEQVFLENTERKIPYQHTSSPPLCSEVQCVIRRVVLKTEILGSHVSSIQRIFINHLPG